MQLQFIPIKSPIKIKNKTYIVIRKLSNIVIIFNPKTKRLLMRDPDCDCKWHFGNKHIKFKIIAEKIYNENKN